jgi:hypothetical protein
MTMAGFELAIGSKHSAADAAAKNSTKHIQYFWLCILSCNTDSSDAAFPLLCTQPSDYSGKCNTVQRAPLFHVVGLPCPVSVFSASQLFLHRHDL